MDIQQALRMSKDELIFIYPEDFPRDRRDPTYKTLRSELGRKGLRRWQSFEENPTYIQKLWDLPTSLSADWNPYIHSWDRVATNELSVVDFYKKTLIARVNAALEAASPGLHIVGTVQQFLSYGTNDNRGEGEKEKHIAPDLIVLNEGMINGNFIKTPKLGSLDTNILAIGEIKTKHPDRMDEHLILLGTCGCYESWLAQPVQYCLDLRISIGFLLTNVELVIFHLSKLPDDETQASRRTRSQAQQCDHESLLSDTPSRLPHSSQSECTIEAWEAFEDGDGEIPYVSIQATQGSPEHEVAVPESPRTPLTSTAPLFPPLITRKRARSSSSERPYSLPARLRQSSSSPSPLGPQKEHDYMTDVSMGHTSPPSQHVAFNSSQNESSYTDDGRSVDPGYVLIKSYPIKDNEEITQRLFEHIMLAHRAKLLGYHKMGPFKLSHSALDALETQL